MHRSSSSRICFHGATGKIIQGYTKCPLTLNMNYTYCKDMRGINELMLGRMCVCVCVWVGRFFWVFFFVCVCAPKRIYIYTLFLFNEVVIWHRTRCFSLNTDHNDIQP